MYQADNKTDILSILKIILLCVKIVVPLGLLYLGVNITLWSVDIIDNIINHTDQVVLFNNIFKQSLEPQIIEITLNSDKLEIKNNGEITWLFNLLIFIILFNVIGRVLAAVFNAMVTILTHFDIDSVKPQTKNNDLQKKH